MESGMDRFRIKLASNSSTPWQSSKAISILNIEPSTTSIGRASACDRCRHFKKKCSKTLPECTSCVSAGYQCSFASSVITRDPGDTQARILWLERFINGSSLLGANQIIEQIATGTDLSELVIEKMSTQAQTPSVTTIADGAEATISSLGARRHLSDASIEVVNTDIESPSKRRRLELSSSVSDHLEENIPPTLPVRVEGTIGTKFVNAYFRDVNRAYPFISRSRVMATLESNGGRLPSKYDRDADSTILYLVMAIGYTSLHRAGQAPSNSSPKFEVKYAEIISECLVQESIDTVQILLLLALYSFCDPHGFSTWPIVDMLTRQAIRLGITRRELADDGLTPAEAEQNHRLFWSIYVLDRMIAISTGMPVALNNVNLNIPLPGLTVEEFASPERGDYTSMLHVARNVIQLRKLEDKVLHEIHLRDRTEISCMTQADRRTVIMNLRTEIEDWYSNGCLLKSTEADEVPIHITVSWLAARYYNLLLLLYYPSYFNPTTAFLSRAELLSLAQKHIQATAIRFQQRHLPLNRITLCRLFPVCMIFLHCFLWHSAGDKTLNAREEISICADILASYPSHWTQAHRAAAIVRQLASLATSMTHDNLPFSAAHSLSLSESDRAWCHAIRVNLIELTQQVLGKGSAYRLLDDWEVSDGPASTSSNPSHRMEQPVATPPLWTAIQSMSGRGGDELGSQTTNTNSTIDGHGALDMPAGGADGLSSGVFSVMDFL